MQLVIPQVNTLADIRHDATDRALAAAARGRGLTARQWARVVILVDSITQNPQPTTEEHWRRVIDGYIEVAQ